MPDRKSWSQGKIYTFEVDLPLSCVLGTPQLDKLGGIRSLPQEKRSGGPACWEARFPAARRKPRAGVPGEDPVTGAVPVRRAARAGTPSQLARQYLRISFPEFCLLRGAISGY
jgi:hypothetical protein